MKSFNKKRIICGVFIFLLIAVGISVLLLANGEGEEAAQETVSQESVESEEWETPELTTEESPIISETQPPITTEPEQETTPEETPETEGDLPLDGLFIGIDAGHQAKGNSEIEETAPGSGEYKAKVSSGTRGRTTGIYEYELNLAVALLLRSELEALGAKVLMVRETNDINVSNQERATMMNDAGVDLCLRIHANGSENTNDKGAMMLIPSGRYVGPIEEVSRQAGEIIFATFLEITGAEDDGVIERSDLTGFNWSQVPVCLIELGYMTNPQEDTLMATEENRSLCAQALAEGICRWFASRQI